MMNPEMIENTIDIIMEGIKRRKRINLIISNRAGENAHPNYRYSYLPHSSW